MQEDKPFPRSLPCFTCSLCICRGIGLSEWTNTPAVLTTVLCTRSPQSRTGCPAPIRTRGRHPYRERLRGPCHGGASIEISTDTRLQRSLTTCKRLRIPTCLKSSLPYRHTGRHSGLHL